jgi:hypothetical protein
MRVIHALLDGVVAEKISDVREQWRQRLVATGVIALCVLAAFGGLVFIAVGSYLSLSEVMAPWQAGLIVGGGVLMLSLIGALSARLMVRRRKPAPPSNKNPSAADAARIDSIARLGETIGASMSRHGIRMADVMIGALVAGTLLGASPALRERLLHPRRNPSGRSGASSQPHTDRR